MNKIRDEIENALIGRTIVDAKVDGFEVALILDDKNWFIYNASDGGYSTYNIERKGEHNATD